MNARTYFRTGTATGAGAVSGKTSSLVCSKLALYSSRYSAGTYVILKTHTHMHMHTHTHTHTHTHKQGHIQARTNTCTQMSPTLLEANNLAILIFRNSISHLSGNYVPAHYEIAWSFTKGKEELAFRCKWVWKFSLFIKKRTSYPANIPVSKHKTGATLSCNILNAFSRPRSDAILQYKRITPDWSKQMFASINVCANQAFYQLLCDEHVTKIRRPYQSLNSWVGY